MLVHIQILRFLAAFAVVAFHALGLPPKGFEAPESAVSLALSYGGHGVDLFFVISGFIIFYTSRTATLSPADFLRRRIERIVPLYFFVIFVFILLAVALPAVFATPGWYTPRHILKSLAFISFTDGEPPVVAVGWSLEYEMYFYLVVALLMALTRQVWRNVVIVFSAAVVMGQLPGVGGALGNYAFFTDPMVLEFVAGVIAGQLFVQRRIGLLVSAAAGCAFAAVLFADPFNRAIMAGIPAACLVAAAAFISRKRIHPSWPERALARLGDASYSIYLAQVETVSLVALAIAALLPAISPLLLLTVTSCIVVALGLLLNITVERPLLKACRRFRSAPAPITQSVRAIAEPTI